MKKFTFPEETINKVLNYLATKPFNEVNNLIAELQATAVEFKEEVKDEKAE